MGHKCNCPQCCGSQCYPCPQIEEMKALESRLAAAEAKQQMDEAQCDKMTAQCAELASRLAAAMKVVELMHETDRWFGGWCPNATCCAHSGRKLHEKIEKALAEYDKETQGK